MEDTYRIYIHTAPNGKMYIGQTKNNLLRRWQNGNGYKDCPKFWNAINKYGWDSFKHDVVYDNLSLEDANLYEEWLIYLGDTTNDKYGYNILSGGKNSARTEETREKISKALSGRQFSDETKKKISEALKGKSHTKEQKQKNRDSQPNNKAVMCVDSGIIYKSVSDASRQTGTSREGIIRVCEHKQKTAGGYEWARM